MPPANRVSFPIPPNFLDFALNNLAILVAIVGSIMRINDYLWSGSFLRAANILPCCDAFDFIVVGGGSAGSAVAARLSENPKFRVLLLEAGGDPPPASLVPLSVTQLLNQPGIDWEYKTVPQNGTALALLNQQLYWPRGKSLGGSSNQNFMIYMRGNKRDYDRWAQHTGDPIWSYDTVEKYFHKIEDYHGNWLESGYHNQGGPLRIESARFAPGLEDVLDGAKEMGFDVRDLNKDQAQGFSPLDLTQKRGLRFSTFRAYIKPNLLRPNLVIYRYSLATKIHFDKLRAVGVTFIRHGVKGYAEARKEIIVCGGAVNSPQLLMLSGIGPQHHLQYHQIHPLVDLPVGLNLQDHVTTVVGPFLINQPEKSFLLHRDVDVGAVFDLALKGSGPLSSPLGIMALGLTSSSFAPSEKWPDTLFTVSSTGVFSGLGQTLDGAFNLANNAAERFLIPDLGKAAHFVLVTLGLPQSRGYIKLLNSNPLSKPIINPRYFSDKNNQDFKVMVEGIQRAVELYENTTSLQRLGAYFPPRNFQGCEHHVFKTREYFECYLREVTLTLFHPSGTCKMGSINDPTSVVDSRLRVLGVQGLRVADASIMPFVTNSNTNGPAIVIGEMCADMIKSEWDS